MKGLIWKDFCLNRPLLVLGALILIGLYGIGVVVEIHSTWPKFPPSKQWAEMLVSYSTISLYLSFVMTGLLGGYAIACERADRTAHFLAFLPPNKAQILASKLVVAASATALWWSWILFTVFVLAPHLGGEASDFTGAYSGRGFAAMCVLTFGVGWLASAYLETTIVPIILANGAPVVLGLLMVFVGDLLTVPRFEMAKWATPAGLTIGIVAFLVGTFHYLRRLEP